MQQQNLRKPRFAEADVKILLGTVDFHYYAGFGGGRKSVLPAICGEETIKQNHAMLLHAEARTGVLQNKPVHCDMTEAARLAKVDFILNVVENKKGEIVKAFAGDLEQAFLEAVKLIDEMYRVTIDRRAEILVVSAGGYPADLTLYQAYKGLDNAIDAVKRGGVIILVAECSEGYGNQTFYDWMTRMPDLKIVEREIKRNFILGGHKAYYLLKSPTKPPNHNSIITTRLLRHQHIQTQNITSSQRRPSRSLQNSRFSSTSLGDASRQLHFASVQDPRRINTANHLNKEFTNA